MLANLDRFDTSNYPKDHPLYSIIRHKVIGVMKDEAGGKIIRVFVGLRPKNYSFIFDKSQGVIGEKRTAKGIQSNFIKKHMRHEMFKECLFNRHRTMATFHQIRSFCNELYTIRTSKIALTPLDDKRFIYDDGVTSVPYGYDPVQT